MNVLRRSFLAGLTLCLAASVVQAQVYYTATPAPGHGQNHAGGRPGNGGAGQGARRHEAGQRGAGSNQAKARNAGTAGRTGAGAGRRNALSPTPTYLTPALATPVPGIIPTTMTPSATELMTSWTSARTQMLPSGIRYEDLVVGQGAFATSGTTVTVHYIGILPDGRTFGSSYWPIPRPFVIQGIGSAAVIPGFNQGVPGMQVGGKRRLILPPDLGYSRAGVPGVIPPSTPVIFEIELLKVE